MSNVHNACRMVTIRYEGEQCERMNRLIRHFGGEPPETCVAFHDEWCEEGKTGDEAAATLERITEGLCPENQDFDEPVPTCELGEIKTNKNYWKSLASWVTSFFHL